MWLIYAWGTALFLLPGFFGLVLCRLSVGEPQLALALFLSSLFLWLFHRFAACHEEALLGVEETNLVLNEPSVLKFRIKELTEGRKRLLSESLEIDPNLTGIPKFKPSKLRFRFNNEDLSLSDVELELKRYQRAYLGWIYTRYKIPCQPFACLFAFLGIIDICRYIRTTFF